MNSKNDILEFLHESDELEKPAVDPPLQSTSSPSSDQPPPLSIENSQLPDRIGTPAVESLVVDANRMSVVPGNSGPNIQFQLAAEDLKLIESDQRLIESRQPVGNPATIRVFGSGDLTGRDFVFVVDRSKSMGNSGLGVLDASRKELSAAVNQLSDNHRFQIVAYHDLTVTLSTRKFLAANSANKRLVPEFLDNLSAYGGTHHENGLMAALAFHPDVIVLMTDGGYPKLHSGHLKTIRRLAGDTTQIHCIQFGAGPLPTKPNFMMQLAEQNNGSFRYIDVNQWKPSP
jgi:hypothetical protein